MKANLKGKIVGLVVEKGEVLINLELAGKADSRSPEARPLEMSGTLKLKQLIANEMKLGSIISVYLTDEETPKID